MDEYFKTLERNADEQVRTTMEKKSRESQAEISRLTQVIELDERHRNEQAQHTREQLAEWDEIGQTIQSLMKQTKALEKPRAKMASK